MALVGEIEASVIGPETVSCDDRTARAGVLVPEAASSAAAVAA
jgi:hypothetical protein